MVVMDHILAILFSIFARGTWLFFILKEINRFYILEFHKVFLLKFYKQEVQHKQKKEIINYKIQHCFKSPTLFVIIQKLRCLFLIGHREWRIPEKVMLKQESLYI